MPFLESHGMQLSNIFGFDDSVILDVIVPIATISFGIDFMIHAVSRCREELGQGKSHRSAYVIGIATVGGALALSTSSIAFGSNATSGIAASFNSNSAPRLRGGELSFRNPYQIQPRGQFVDRHGRGQLEGRGRALTEGILS